MTDFLLTIKKRIPDKKKRSLTQSDLQKWGLRGIQLRNYQLDGVHWLTQCLENQEGCILGDEMGLGKTCQTISLLLYITGECGKKGPFLVVSPLSVMENWRKEMESFAPSLKILCYQGDKERRAEIQQEANTKHFSVLLTTYEMCLRDASFFKKWKWEALVVDEAHRLKNQNSLLYQTLIEFSLGFRMLLTGTPIQNNLHELYSLLSFIQPSVFTADDTDSFLTCYCNVQKQSELAAELQSVLEPFLLRRVKSEVALDLPKKTELVMYHGMTALQKKYYKAILTKDPDAFGNEQGKLNILMQLRKCVIHPYLFDGVEPEPFVMGEHLVEASGKFCILDSMLIYLHKGGHRVLLFSQMTRTLDILQDYMEYRGYSYERLDGSVRGEERNLAVKNFSTNDIFVFLLSTKAGGVGMNLTAADTVIFMDTDFNPQNDLQAAARCHRIGQNRPVKIIRLLARDTVEEIMYSRAISKLHLTNTVIEEGRFSLLDQAQSAAAVLKLSEILKFGVNKLLSSDESSVQEVKLEKILGLSNNGQWLDDEASTAAKGTEEEESGSEFEGPNHMYYFEGRDYSKDPSSEDQRSFEHLIEDQLTELQKVTGEGRALRHNTTVSLSLVLPTRKHRALTEAELELRRQRRKEAAAKRARMREDFKKEQQEEKYRKKMAWWESSGYRSLSLPLVESEDEEEEDEEDSDSISSTDSEANAIHYILGDVTHPQASKENAIIVHCVDDSGRWGRGGLFTALEVRSDEPKKQYELAGKMKDLELGNVLLFPIDDKQSRLDGQDQLALIVAQQRDKANNLSGILLTALEEGLKKIYTAAKKNRACVHLPRIGHSTKGFNWYGTERLIRKYLATRGVPTYIYYHSRSGKNSSAPPQTSPPPPTSTSCSDLQRHNAVSDDSPKEAPGPSTTKTPYSHSELPSFMSGVRVFFYNLPASDRKRLARYLITYDGDEEDIMSSDVTHIVAEVDNKIHLQELEEMLEQYNQAVPVKKSWLESCFSKQRRADTTQFLLLK
ncbi:chromodomain-helicase-DNA-binding protein 1-like isoform X2 [Periophthalmus magnuspinnatus]|uniref:chromodomain-helicase-DNA-binding protein 1-like isoform X2 n=1 Tax=Periophthalmus magnuspinnatus TaxID=409849 RepID=UPI00145BFDE6|nr:chromodomain-helicase-DNA-binding protein 1-like isoform X2 [Periophthalmus magnuspinnatus]